jgi:hypothetical protein
MRVDRDQLEIFARAHGDAENGAADQQNGGEKQEIDIDALHHSPSNTSTQLGIERTASSRRFESILTYSTAEL